MFRALVDVWFIFAPSAGYILQVQDMTRTRRTDGYSLEGSLILLVCNAARVIYFFGEPFAVALLLQSFMTIAVQLALVLTVLKINAAHAVLAEELAKLPSWVPTGGSFAAMPSLLNVARSGMISGTLVVPPAGGGDDAAAEDAAMLGQTKRSRRNQRSGGSKSGGGGGVATWMPRQFLMRFIIGFTTTFAVSMVAFMQIPGTPQLLGYVAMGIEATQAIPQLLLNKSRQSCEGLALPLVGNWIFGDVVKTIYFLVLSQPAPFIVSAFTQLALDAVLIYQLVVYRPGRGGLPLGATPVTGSPLPSPVVSAGRAAIAASSSVGGSHRHRHRRTLSLQQQQQANAAGVPPSPSAVPFAHHDQSPPPPPVVVSTSSRSSTGLHATLEVAPPAATAKPSPTSDAPVGRRKVDPSADATPSSMPSSPATTMAGATAGAAIEHHNSIGSGTAGLGRGFMQAHSAAAVQQQQHALDASGEGPPGLSHSTIAMGDSTDSDFGYAV